MDIIIHDSKLKKVAYIDNELQDTLSFYDDKWSRYLDTASSTFEFTVYKKGIKSDSVKEKAYQTLTERSFVSFKYNKRTYLFNVMRTEETETTIRCYCENLNLELLNEMAGPFKATTEMSFVDYCNKFFLLVGGAITVGHNEIEDRERTLEWTGTDTKLKRLLSIANQFDAEIEFVTELNEDSSLKSFILNIYKENDENNQGVGRIRNDVVLRYGHNVDGVTRTIDKTGIFNMITPIGKTTVDVTTTKANPKYVAPQLGTVNYNGGAISNAGRTINKDLVNEILNLCVQHKLLPSGVFSQLYLESWWGNSPVARADNNWGGLTWTGSGNRPSGVTVTQGTARPANEGGYYMHFASVSDYMKDYTYLLAEQGIYKVKGANSIDSYTKGLFRVGGATYDYAAAGYDHYAPLMRSIRNGINSASNGAMDTLDAQLKSAGTVGTAPVSQKADKVISTLNALTAKKGQLIGSGQCYALSAWYAMTLGGPWLGGGVTNGFKGLIGAGSAAAQIGEDYNWSQFGWKMVRPSQVSHLIPGSIANIKANFNGGFLNTTGWGHTVVIKAISGDTLTVLEQNFAGHQYVEERTYSASAYLGAIQTLCYPPEIVQGKRIDGTESAPVQSGNNEPSTISETQQKEVITRIPTDLYREWKNEEGVVEFYVKNGSLYAPLSKELYPSAFTGDEVNDNWIKKSVEYETSNVEDLISNSLSELRKKCYPSISYDVNGTATDLDLGDTIKVDDEEFNNGLVLSARVSEQHIVFTNRKSDKTIFDNYVALKNKLSKDLIARSEELAELARPYELRLLTDKGVTFHNSTGLSVLSAELWKSNKQYDATYQFRNFDTLLASGLQCTIDGSTISPDNPLVVSVDAYIGNDMVATRQITFTNVLDGAQGAQGPAGADGLTYYPHTAWANSADGKIDFSITDSTGRRYKGDYSDTNVNGSTDPTKYKWVNMVGTVTTGNRNFLAQNLTVSKFSSKDFTTKAWGADYINATNTALILKSGETYTVSFDAEIVGKSTITTINQLSVGFLLYSASTGRNVDLRLVASKNNAIQNLNQKGRFEATFVCPELASDHKITLYTNRYYDGTTADNDTVRFTNVNWTFGNVVSKSWIRPLEDVDDALNSKADQALTQEQMNLLLETQNLMTAEMRTKATAEQVDALIASYNKYVSDEAVNKANVEAELIANAERIEAFRKDYDDKMLQLDFVSNYMRATDLGLEVSASDGSSSLLVQKDRISMFSAGKEVMYISQGFIHIDNGVFTKTLQIGNFRESQADGDPTTNVEIYVG
ncbi:glucosaminidase domain-containing protein [Streptococcus uberis]|uniref:glucosaminidase domain-containing protein n=1 Tax=Streptococcus uberis TaxID=1349 RepID=UPI001FF51DE7|nr:glucosaminidase domain-containing protein [Streptococcus uberis]MCK1219607.1 mannosyl-glycoprotein endo-beta-N-acetylglucosamidase [Streptococcus uberis]